MSKQLSREVRDRDISSIRKGETLDLEEQRIAWMNKICEEAKEHDFTCLRDCRTAKTLEEVKELIESGFEYVTDMDGFKLFRKRK